MIGETILPSNIPNLNHSKFNGVRLDELNSPKNKKTNEVIKAHKLYSWLLIRGYKETAKKNIKKDDLIYMNEVEIKWNKEVLKAREYQKNLIING